MITEPTAEQRDRHRRLLLAQGCVVDPGDLECVVLPEREERKEAADAA
jgi:hypothetical protein